MRDVCLIQSLTMIKSKMNSHSYVWKTTSIISIDYHVLNLSFCHRMYTCVHASFLHFFFMLVQIYSVFSFITLPDFSSPEEKKLRKTHRFDRMPIALMCMSMCVCALHHLCIFIHIEMCIYLLSVTSLVFVK